MALYKNRFENLEDKHNTIYKDKNQKKSFKNNIDKIDI